MGEWVSCLPARDLKAFMEVLFDVQCARHGRMMFQPESGLYWQITMWHTYDNQYERSGEWVTGPARWKCRGFDGEGCASFARHDMVLNLARGEPVSAVSCHPDVSACFRAPQAAPVAAIVGLW